MAHQTDLFAKFKRFTATVAAAGVSVTAASATFHTCLDGNLSLGNACKLYDHRPHIEVTALSTGTNSLTR